MAVERRVLRSVSEFSMFKYLLVFYLVFFILMVIIFGIIALVAWLGFSFSGANINELMQNYGINQYLGFAGGGILGIILIIIGGLIASVFYAAVGTLAIWICNVMLKISGGIELRFSGENKK